MKFTVLSVLVVLVSIGIVSAHAPVYEGEKLILAEGFEEDHSFFESLKSVLGNDDSLPKDVVAEYGVNYLSYQVSQSGVHSYNVSLMSIEESKYDSLYKAKYNLTIKGIENNETVYISDDGREMMRVPKTMELPSDFELNSGETVEEYVKEGDSHEH